MGTLTKQAALKTATKPSLAGKATARTAATAPAWSRRAMRALGGENVVDVLTRQHRQIRLGFLRAALPGPWRRRNFDRLMRLLAVHEAAEEAHVHPVARRVLRHGRELAARRRAEEKQAKELLIALWHTGPDGAGYLRRLNEVRRVVSRHAAREEREEFQALRKAISLPRLRMLGAEVKFAQAYAPTRPHRWVNNEATNKLAAPILGPVDRALDALRRRSAS
ncbi:hemerythrin domain-containing protein [Streptomyces sp. NPDC044780]|uniref:Hemerythrin domain-containing protein n=1 Tax=Streptomyces luomodiensis TaxID=3026192 RepID=A0ABY9V8X7_9ACTN|nr:hemerythrin domain-containing protein [Streptomyces sp. SCA4-21]WNF01102.1 hemerythrin domain-containing protein [Streptomyces sp. SCA4-21]